MLRYVIMAGAVALVLGLVIRMVRGGRGPSALPAPGGDWVRLGKQHDRFAEVLALRAQLSELLSSKGQSASLVGELSTEIDALVGAVADSATKELSLREHLSRLDRGALRRDAEAVGEARTAALLQRLEALDSRAEALQAGAVRAVGDLREMTVSLLGGVSHESGAAAAAAATARETVEALRIELDTEAEIEEELLSLETLSA